MFGFFKRKPRQFEVRADDTFLVAYPKSGITWLRFLVGNYLNEGNCDFSNSHLIIPDIHYNPEYCLQINKPRFIKSHLPYTASYPKVIYLVRDGRDVAVSYFFHLKKYRRIRLDTTFQDFMTDFNAGRLDRFGRWGEHVTSWLDHQNSNLLLIRYEDLKDDTGRVFEKILKFCGYEIDKGKINMAIEASSIERMRRSETEQGRSNELFSSSDQSISFVRRGEKGQWQQYFDKSLLDVFVEHHGIALSRLNYAIDGR
ncbi:MAG: sulfotransferase domain-containing protein [Acidiferrobacterales bacterium]